MYIVLCILYIHTGDGSCELVARNKRFLECILYHYVKNDNFASSF